MKKHFIANCLLISLLNGAFAYFIASFVIEEKWALMFALLFAASLMIVLPIIVSVSCRKYKGIENGISERIILNENVNMRHNHGLRNGCFILTMNCVYLFGRDRKPYLEERIDRKDIRSVEAIGNTNLNIHVSDDSIYSITGSGCKEIVKTMKDTGWIQ